ncbi:hypothetical protein BDC45DRAFT_572280 [Circinella umbellata]|nr:hypothetical protein BDC45DRAFT_572280 [Circinella umbellata]
MNNELGCHGVDYSDGCYSPPSVLPHSGGFISIFNLTSDEFGIGTIRTYLDSNPIEPTVALAHFFIEQKLFMISMERCDDSTVPLFFKYAKDTLQLIKARETLTEHVRNIQSRKRTAQVLDDGILFVNEMCKNHSLSQEPSGSPSPSSATSSTTSLPSSFTNFD